MAMTPPRTDRQAQLAQVAPGSPGSPEISQKMSKAATCSISSMQWPSIGSMSKYFKCQSMYSESPAMQVALVLLHRQSFKYPRWKVFLTESASTSLSSSTSASCCVRLCSEVAWWLLIRRLLRHQFMSQHSPSCQQHLHVRPRRKCFQLQTSRHVKAHLSNGQTRSLSNMMMLKWIRDNTTCCPFLHYLHYNYLYFLHVLRCCCQKRQNAQKKFWRLLSWRFSRWNSSCEVLR